MGTRGLLIYDSAGIYYIFYISRHACPEVWGLYILRDMPHGHEDTPDDKVRFSKWLDDTRRWLESLLMDRIKLRKAAQVNKDNCAAPAEQKNETGHGISTADGQQDVEGESENDDEDYLDDDDDEEFTNGLMITRSLPYIPSDFEYVYELDLDNLTFLVGGFPLFNMSCMPPEDRFARLIGHDHYSHLACAPTTPEQYRGGREPVDIHKLIHTRPTPTHLENVRLRMLETLIGSCLTHQEYGCCLHALPILEHRGDISQILAAVLNYLLFLATLPMVYYTDYCFKYSVCIDEPSGILWPRRNICSMLWTHLDDEPNLRAAIVHLTREAAKDKDGPDIVYGILFSGIHIAIVRIDRKHHDAFTHTPALQFLPSCRRALKSHFSPMEPAEKMEARWKRTIQFRDGGLLDHLPGEILSMIADNLLDDRSSLLIFSRICSRTAAISRDAVNHVYVHGYRLTNVIDLPQNRHELAHGCFDAVSQDGESVRLHLGRPRLASKLTGEINFEAPNVYLPEFLSDATWNLEPRPFFLYIADTSNAPPTGVSKSQADETVQEETKIEDGDGEGQGQEEQEQGGRPGEDSPPSRFIDEQCRIEQEKRDRVLMGHIFGYW
ncbi:hypothetical protein EWM64_g1575 [Hericium alpestre]|uniref:F-box domain-containing protein n=1 Tax=Hericium alpestre TaxID=135208 RepID=A0A4Z0AA88_9AGAM|nr:hypothetical protein EWM64_g1575 [Hericium alpestre]